MKTLYQFITEALEKANAFCMLKPGFLEYESEFEKILKENGWKIVDKVKKKLTDDEAKELYISHKDENYYEDLWKYTASDDIIAYRCYKDCDDPIKDMDELKDEIREKWGKSQMKNAMHSSDSEKNVERESKILF